jgi:aspartyl-tRNA(Asn)/glutamyl-tRNA(Gln) amidotransferase subunit B
MSAAYEPVIGIEVHAQLLTSSKAFCGCSTRFGETPNSHVCPVCLGLPGALPVLNRQVVDLALRMGLATGCRISSPSIFARKHYFYPDLPKGYQISQYEQPLCVGGAVEIDLEDGTRRRIGITRIHVEEDAGKSMHTGAPETRVDVNRCGVPLIEIVTEPDIRSAREAALTLLRIRQLVTFLGVCDGNMEEGNLRCDANVSVRPAGDTRLGTKTELKNMNSFRFVERALEFEIARQIRLVEEGGVVRQETLLWDPDKGAAFPMRSKEEAHDYRYFPEPDLVPVMIDEGWIACVREALPELPTARRDRLVRVLGLPMYDAEVLTAEREIADYAERCLQVYARDPQAPTREEAKQISNWVMTEVLRVVGETKVRMDQFPISPERLAALLGLAREGVISGKIAKDVFGEMLTSSDDPAQLVRSKGLTQVSDPAAIEEAVERVLAAREVQVQEYLGGSQKVFGFFVGETMKLTRGKANPGLVNVILKRKLEARRS